MTMDIRRQSVACMALLLLFAPAVCGAPVSAGETSLHGSQPRIETPVNHKAALEQTTVPVMPSLPLLLAEGSNSCEIVSCGMGIKQTCQISCPAEKTPKCSCDCERSFGPMCMDYKANCRCE